MLKYLFVAVSVFSLSSCGTVPTPTSKNPAEVTFRFKETVAYKNGASEDNSVLTFWRKIEEDGKKSGRIAVGKAFRLYDPTTIQLDPGTYYLDSFQVGSSQNSFCVSQGGHYLTRNGWDDAANKPYYLSFTIKEGDVLELPEVVFNSDCKSAAFKDPKNVFTVGSKLAVKK